MDTREKIISLQQAKALLANGRWTIIVGLFDPLTALQARRIEDSGGERTLLVVLEDSDTLLPADVRCCLVAALRSVDYVVPAGGSEWLSFASYNDKLHVIDDGAAEKRRSQDFIELIAARQGD